MRPRTDINNNNRELQERITEIDLIYETAPVGLCFLDRELRFIRLNRRMAEINGLSVKEHLGRTIREVCPDLAPRAKELAERIFRTGDSIYDIETSGTTPADPEEIHYWIEHWAPLKNPEGNIIGINVSVEDITDRINLEAELKEINEKLEETVSQRTADLYEANELLEKIFSSVHFLIAYLDFDFNFIRVNRAYARAYNKTPMYFIGKNHFDLFPDEENKNIFHRVRETSMPFVTYAKSFIPTVQAGQGVTYWDWSLRSVKGKEGEVEGFLLILVDVSEQKRSEEKLIRARKKMSDMEHLADLGTLSSMVAHEMRTPLATIKLAADNIRRKTDNPSLIKHIRSITNKVNAGERIITSLLGYSRIQLPHYKKFYILPLLKGCIADSRKAHHKKKILVQCNLNPIKRKKIEADPDQIRLVFSNILDNAFDACLDDDCRIEISAWIQEDSTAIFQFSNTGIPIPPEDLKEIFTPFFTRKTSGTGLGLSICRNLVRLHDGFITLKSAPEKTTVVSVHLPLRSHI